MFYISPDRFVALICFLKYRYHTGTVLGTNQRGINFSSITYLMSCRDIVSTYLEISYVC